LEKRTVREKGGGGEARSERKRDKSDWEKQREEGEETIDIQ